MKDILIQAGPWLIVAVLAALPGTLVLIKREQVERAIRRVLPDGTLEDLAVKAAMEAYQVVEQKTGKLAEKSNEERLALAQKYFDALLDFYRHGNLTDLAKEALIELEVWAQHQGAKTA